MGRRKVLGVRKMRRVREVPYAQRMVREAALPALCTLLLCWPAPASAQMRTQVVASGLVNPVAYVMDPDDHSTFYAVEQRGTIRTVRDNAVSSAFFLDLRGQISSGGERGLLGMAFPPDAQTSRRFFVTFTNPGGDFVVARFARTPDGAVSINSRFDLMWPDGRRFVQHPFSNHNGGHLAFGPDGYLYVGMGDGGSGGDPFNNAQNPNSLHQVAFRCKGCEGGAMQ